MAHTIAATGADAMLNQVTVDSISRIVGEAGGPMTRAGHEEGEQQQAAP